MGFIADDPKQWNDWKKQPPKVEEPKKEEPTFIWPNMGLGGYAMQVSVVVSATNQEPPTSFSFAECWVSTTAIEPVDWKDDWIVL